MKVSDSARLRAGLKLFLYGFFPSFLHVLCGVDLVFQDSGFGFSKEGEFPPLASLPPVSSDFSIMTATLALRLVIILQKGRRFEQCNKEAEQLINSSNGWFVLLRHRESSVETMARMKVKLGHKLSQSNGDKYKKDLIS